VNQGAEHGVLSFPTRIEKFIVTKQRSVSIENIEIEKEFLGVAVDVYGSINGYPIVLYFTHPGRAVPVELKAPEAEKCGIVEVSLSDTYSLFIGDRSAEQSYLEKLRVFLADDMRNKHWIFHPRYRHMQERVDQALAARREKLLRHMNEEMNHLPGVDSASHSVSSEKFGSEETKRKVKYQCVMCGTTWIGIEPGYSSCPKCKTHLFGRRVGNVDNET
jgi:hypothetical protein